MLFKLALNSLLDRKASVLLTIFAMALSISVLLGVEHIRQQAKAGFANSVAGVDLIVGARTSKLQLLLFSIFQIGSPNHNLDWHTYQSLKNQPKVKWAIPLALGDSHKSHRVVATEQAYFQHFRYGKQKPLRFKQGLPFQQPFELVLGYEAAKRLHYRLGQEIFLSHGLVDTHFTQHSNRAFTVVGILAATATPVDQALFVSLASLEAIHQQPAHNEHGHEAEHSENVSAILIGLKNKSHSFQLQAQLNHSETAALTAILPGVALAELWQLSAGFENALRLIALLVLLASLFGMAATLLASLRERRQEVYLLRLIGASRGFLFVLIQFEALLITLLAAVLACLATYFLLNALQPYLLSNFGIQSAGLTLDSHSLAYLALITLSALVLASLPALKAYSMASLQRD